MAEIAPRAPIDPIAVNAVLYAVRQAANVLCDRWTLLVLLHAQAGASRFADLQARCGCASRLLASRLAMLEAQELLVRMPYSRRPLRMGYHLTPMGQALFEVFAALLQWQQRWHASASPAGLRLDHLSCGAQGIVPVSGCQACGEPVRAHDVVLKISQKGLREMPGRASTYRRSSAASGQARAGHGGPLPQALAVLGDKWTIEVVMCAFVRIHGFGAFQAHTGMSTNILADRLARLTAAGVLVQATPSDDLRRSDYRLTPAGTDLLGVLLCIEAWADHWLRDRARSPMRLLHRGCGQPLRVRLGCSHCGQVLRAGDCRWEVSAAASEQGPRP